VCLSPLRTPCTDTRHRLGRLGSLDTRRGTPYLSKTASAPGVRARAMARRDSVAVTEAGCSTGGGECERYMGGLAAMLWAVAEGGGARGGRIRIGQKTS
jgi:hypothetical protein